MDKHIFLFGIFIITAIVLASPAEAGLHTYTFENTALGVKVIVKALAPLNVTITPIADPTAIDPNRDGTWGGLNKFFNLNADKAFDSAEVRVKYEKRKIMFGQK
ncbi:MAG: hypothetical protein HYT16_03155 [DPANN group archaeon]|nr:hypothetical protein [DPANN group archaeon]